MRWDINVTADILMALVCWLVDDVGSDYKASHDGPMGYISLLFLGPFGERERESRIEFSLNYPK